VKLELSVTPELLAFADIIKHDWEVLGVNVEVKVVSSRPEKYQALLTSMGIPVDPDQYALWHSTQETTNLTHFKDEQVDKNLEDGRRTIDTEARRKIYLDFQRFLLEEAPAIFLYHPVNFQLVRR
jgi:peptide/nickel transport system substrate-binding protein